MKKELNITLQEPINVSKNGEMIESCEITIYSPASSQINEVCVLDNAVGKAQMALMDSPFFEKMFKQNKDSVSKPQSDEGMDGNSIIELLSKSGEVGVYQRCFDSLKKILKSGKKADIEGQPMTEVLFEQISIPDVKKILGEYIANFIIASPASEKK